MCDEPVRDSLVRPGRGGFLGILMSMLFGLFGSVVIIVAVVVALLWFVARFRARRKFYRRIVALATKPVLVYNNRGELFDLTPGLLIFERRPADPITSKERLFTHLSHTRNRVEIDSIVYRCTVKSLVDKKWGEYTVAELEVEGRSN